MTAYLSDFLDFSVEMTCFTRFELLGTGQAENYAEAARAASGAAFDELLARYGTLKTGPDRIVDLRHKILGDEYLGPVARAIIKMWYIGIWYELPRSWTEKFGARASNTSRMVTPAAYAEGLLWTAIGAHPPGAKAPGYGSWARPPSIPAFTCSLAASTGGRGGGPGGGHDPGPMVTQVREGHVAPHHAPKSEHPPPHSGDFPK